MAAPGLINIKKYANNRHFPEGTVDRNPRVKARDMGSIPGPGRFYTPRSN